MSALDCCSLSGVNNQTAETGKLVIETEPYYIVRRLTPTECARLQGMPDWWCADVPHADSAEYKMWGNGMALPNVLYVIEGIAERMKEEEWQDTLMLKMQG